MVSIKTMKTKHIVILAWFVGVLPASAAEVPFPAALDAAAIVESRISDINREALVLGNGDLNGLLWERNTALCLRVAKNDVWDARIDTSQDVPLMQVDVPNQKWSGGGYPPSWRKPYPQPRCAAVIVVGAANEAVVKSARLDLRRAVAEVGFTNGAPTVVRALADRNVFLIETDKTVSLEEIKAKELPAAELGETGGV